MNNHPSVRQFIVMARFMLCLFLSVLFSPGPHNSIPGEMNPENHGAWIDAVFKGRKY
jgi:hypothetical protein